MFTRAAFAIFLATACCVNAQEAFLDALPAPPPMIAAPPPMASEPPPTVAEPLPSSAWLDLRQTMSRNSKTQEAPAWVEALTLLPGELTEGEISLLPDRAAAHAERIARLKQQIAFHAKLRDKLRADCNQAALSCKRAPDDLDRAKRPLLQHESAEIAREIEALAVF